MTDKPYPPENIGPWLRHLRDLAQGWIKERSRLRTTAQTPAYVDLIFAFGLARLGEIDSARELLGRSQAALGNKDDAHQFLLTAYKYRILQAIEGKPHTGPLPADQIEYLEHMERLQRYVVDRLRRHSRILEPDQKIDPYRNWGARISDFDRALVALPDLTDPGELAERIGELLKGLPADAAGAEQRARVLRAGLEAAPRINEEFARQMLDQAVPAYDALPEARELQALMDQAAFLEAALFTAVHFDRIEYVHPLVARFQRMLQTQRGPQAVHALDSLAGQWVRSFLRLGLRGELAQLLSQMADAVLEGQQLKSVNFGNLAHGSTALRALLHVAAGWYGLGHEAKADAVIRAAWALLLKDRLYSREQTALACTYALTMSQAPWQAARERLEDLFSGLKGIRDTYTTSNHFSVSQLEVIEAVVLTVLGRHAPPEADVALTVPVGP